MRGAQDDPERADQSLPGGVFLALAGQIFLSFYQSGTVLRELDDQMGNFNAISRFQNGVERSLSAMEDYRWEYGDAKALTEELHSAFSVTNAWLWRIEGDLGTVSEEQYLLYNAVSTTYDSYTALVDQLEEAVAAGQDAKAAQLYYNKIVPCGGYLRQYTQQLLNTAITDAQGTYTTVSALSDRVKWVQTVVVALCLALGCVMAFSVLTLLTPVQQMIGASREVTRGEFDSPDLPAPRQPEMAQLTEAFNHMKHSMAEQVTTLREKTRWSGSSTARRRKLWNYRTGWSAAVCSSCAAGSTPFPFQHPERHFTDRRTGKSLPHAGPSSRLCRTCCATAR